MAHIANTIYKYLTTLSSEDSPTCENPHKKNE